jgi:hypothetical protein
MVAVASPVPTQEQEILTFRLVAGDHIGEDLDGNIRRWSFDPNRHAGNIIKTRIPLDKKFNQPPASIKFERLSVDPVMAQSHLPSHCFVYDATKETPEQFIERMRALEKKSDAELKSSASPSSSAPAPAPEGTGALRPNAGVLGETKPNVANTAAREAAAAATRNLSTDLEAINGMTLDELKDFAKAEGIQLSNKCNLKDRNSVLREVATAYHKAQ